MKRIFTFCILLILINFKGWSQISVSGGSGLSATYTSLTNTGGLFEALNNTAQSGNNIVVTITADVTTEVGTNALNGGAWTTITIKPSGIRTISGTVAAPLIDLNGVKNITIDGSNTGGNSLTISNIYSTSSTGISTIRFINGASNNTIQNCTILGAATTTSAASVGTILFSIGSSTTGNNLNTISGNTISAASTGVPMYGVVSAGTSASIMNTANTINNNNIADYYIAGGALGSIGLYIASNSSAWTITGNRFYQTAIRTATAGNLHEAIKINTPNGVGYTVSDNIIGYANSSASGTTTYTGSSGRFIGIDMAVGTTTASSVQGNNITSFKLTTSSAATIFTGIYVGSGNVSMGTTTGNIVGSASGTGSIFITGGNGASINGISVTSASNLSIQNNIVASISTGGASGYTFYGIATSGAGSYTLIANSIGNTTANSIAIGTSGTIAATVAHGIWSDASGTTQTIGSNGFANRIQNITCFGANDYSQFYGIIYKASTPASILNIQYNILYGNTVVGSASNGFMTLIFNNTNVGTANIINNVIRNSTIGSGTGTFGTAYYAILNKGGTMASTININFNTISTPICTGSIGANIFVIDISQETTVATQNIKSNIFEQLSLKSLGPVYLINLPNSSTASDVSSNVTSGAFTRIPAIGTVGDFYGIANFGFSNFPGTTANIYNNNFSNIDNGNSTGSMYGINCSTGATQNIYNNTISSISSSSGNGFYGILSKIYGITKNINGNTVSNITYAGPIYALWDDAGKANNAKVSKLYGNTISALSSSSGPVFGLSYNSAGTTTSCSIYANSVYSLSTTNPTALGLNLYYEGNSSVTNSYDVYKNKISNITSTNASASSTATGINVNSFYASNINLYNNLVGNITAPTSTNPTAVSGITIAPLYNSGATPTVNVYYNTIYLTGSGGTGFGGSAIWQDQTNGNSNLLLKNNILVNLATPKGTGISTAIRRTSTNLSFYGSLSNNNLLYCGTPSANQLIYYDGTNKYQTLTDYQTGLNVSPRDAAAVTEDPTTSFISTDVSNMGFLHFTPGAATQAESGAAPISGYPDDYDGDVRNSATPDIGADEFAGAINYCATPTWTGNISTDWNVAGNWCRNLIPVSTTAVTIPVVSSARYPLISNANAVAASITINSGASLTMSGAYNLTLSSGAGVTNNGTFTGTASTGAIIFAGTGTVAGTVSFNNVTINGVVDFRTASTVNGNLTINSGGAAGGIYGTNLINYGAASTLIYNTTLATGNEWYTGGSGTITPGAGIPQNVTILSGTITIPNSGGANRALAGNLIINSGSTLQMTAATSRDIYIAGNWTNNGGTFTANGRKVTFDAAGTSLLPVTQTLSGTTTFYDLTFGNSYVTTDFGSSTINILDNLRNDAGSMNGNLSAINFTGTSGLILGTGSKFFYNLSVNSGNNVADNVASTGDIHIDNSFINNGTFSQLSSHTIYFDKSGAAETISGTGSTVFGNFTIGGPALSFSTILNTGSSNFTISGTALSFNSKGSTFISSTGIVTFALSTAGNCTVKNASGVTGTSASFFNVLINPPVGGIATALDFGNGISSINNTLTINNYGSVITNAPVYGSAASLVYNTTTAAYATGLEWSVNSTTPGAGVPKNVTLQNTNNILLLGDRGIGGNLTISSVDSLNLNNHTLTLNGSISNTGYLTGSSSSGLIIGGVAGTVHFGAGGKNNVLQTFTVNSSGSITLGDSLYITAGAAPGVLTANGTINSGNYLVLRSDINGTPRVAASSGAINGNVTVERYIATGTTHAKSWQLLAIPHNGPQTINNAWQEGCSINSDCNPGFGTQITGATGTAAGFDVYSPLPSMKVWNATTASYVGVSGTTIPIKNQKGYFVFIRGDRSTLFNQPAVPTTLRTKGPLFTTANLPPTTSIAIKQTESVGNPYASAIDKRKIGLAGVDSFFIVWDPKLGGAYGLGAFQYFAWDGTNYTVTPGGGSYGKGGSINNNIESGQAFFVQTTKTAGTVSFSESAKVSGSLLVNSPVRDPQSPQLLRTNLYGVNTDGSTFMIDGTLNSFDQVYNNGVDGQDARKNANTTENLSISVAGNLLSIERRQMVSEQDTIFLDLTGVRTQRYRYEFIAQNMNVEGLQGFVEDTYLHTRTLMDLNGTTLVDFTIVNVPGSYASDRFQIVFTPSVALPVTFTSVKAHRQAANINVEWKVENERNIKDYEVEKSADGLLFKTMVTKAATGNSGNSANYLAADIQPVTGYNYYRIRSNDQDKKTQVTKVVRVLMGTIKQDISIYPNPITDGMIHLQFMNEPEGKYLLRLMNKAGQVILSKQVTRMDGSNTELIKWDYNLAHGTYQLEVTRPDGSVKNINVMY